MNENFLFSRGEENSVYREIEKEFDSPYQNLIRISRLITLLIIVSFAVFGLIISYPDMMMGEMILSNTMKPQVLLPRNDAKVSGIYKEDGQLVKKGDLICTLESVGNYQEILTLEKELTELAKPMSDMTTLPEDVQITHFNNLGELQNSFEEFYMHFRLVRSEISSNVYQANVDAVHNEIDGLKKLNSVLDSQRTYLVRDLEISALEYKTYKQLNEAKAVTIFEANSYESKYVQRKNSIEHLNVSIINNENVRRVKERELLALKSSIWEKKLALGQSIALLKAEIANWKSQYTIVAINSGVLRFSEKLVVGDFITRTKKLMFLVQKSDDYQGEMLVDQDNFGSLEVGQQVQIKLRGYPFFQYGMLIGKVTRISFIASSDEKKKFSVLVSLPAKNTSTLGKNIVLRNGMVADAEIVTQRNNFFQKVVHNYRKNFTKNG